MSKCKRSVLVATLIYICAASPAGAAPEVCVRLLEHGVYDEAQKYTYDDQLRAVRSALCKSFSSTYEEARDTSARAGIDIIGELSGYAGGEVRSNNFDEVRRNYCRDISSLSTSSEEIRESVRRISSALVNSFTQCVALLRDERPGVYPYLKTMPDFSVFSVEIAYRPPVDNPSATYDIESIDSFPSGAVNCIGEFPMRGISDVSVNILCEKPEDRDVTVIVRTSQRDLTGTTVPGAPSYEEMVNRRFEQIDARFAAIDGRVNNNELQILSGRVPHGAFLLMPDRCPGGYNDVTSSFEGHLVRIENTPRSGGGDGRHEHDATHGHAARTWVHDPQRERGGGGDRNAMHRYSESRLRTEVERENLNIGGGSHTHLFRSFRLCQKG